MFSTILTRTAVATLTALTFTACSDSTGPGSGQLDPDRAHADAEAMMAAFDSPAMQQFMAMAYHIDLGGQMQAVVSGVRQTVAAGGRVSPAEQRAIATAIQSALFGDPDIAAMAVLPQDIRGKTFVFVPSENAYLPSHRVGAPVNGVRFVLYALDGNGDPDVGTESGHLELIDLAPAGATNMGVRVRVVGGGTTFLDYSVQMAASQSSASVNLSGYVTNGTTRVNYTTQLALAGNGQSQTASINYTYTVPARNFAVQGSITGFGGEQMGQIDIRITSNRAQLRYVFATGGVFSGTAYLNGKPFATLTESEYGIQMTGANGTTLTEAEIDMLHALLALGVEGFFSWVVLLAPVGALMPF